MAEPMDDEIATRDAVPEVWTPAQAKDLSGGGLALIQKAMIRHRLEEAAMLAAFQVRVLSDVQAVAGAENAIGTAARARIQDATTQAETLEKLARGSGAEGRVLKDGRVEP